MEPPKNGQLDFPFYEALYKDLHQNPGLSLQEVYASTKVSENLNRLNESLPADSKFDIHEGIGGYGIAAVLKNGPGPKVLLRADMDALPVQEKTGLPYASTKREVDRSDGIEKPLMHACGHDMHITCLLAASDTLVHRLCEWSGTLILIFQPNEERGAGAQAMVDGGLYSKIPEPDVVLGQHVMPRKAGTVTVRTGTQMAAADSFKITLFGRGGHGSMPHNCIDPVLLGANVVTRLHQVVGREIDPSEPAVLTVGSLQSGDTENVISEYAIIRANVRSQSPQNRERILAAMTRIVKGECQASGCTKDPLIEGTTRFPMTVNDAGATAKVKASFSKTFGEKFEPERPAMNASEDVSILATSVGKPSCFWFFGGTDRERYDRAEKDGRTAEDIPVNHSSYFAPVIQPTLKTGAEALCSGAMTFFGKGKQAAEC
ncbi:uncharacterized protein KY384_001115 [Bacidia gigantensis]|uniref:uncharacterized protein n=1 Tax=Bacidia gigantensis TaxID=2732470 RepID=UPI001D03B47E|nr:uncharacterized protein KY384_001115 [Bacidia gigantensis]KAG8534271.1 hypothetical protein KY384_001115 [Bacidia gigantensis]